MRPWVACLPSDCLCGCGIVFAVAEIQAHINGYFNKVQDIKEKAQEENGSGAAQRCDLYDLPADTEGVPNQQEHLEEETFAFGSSGDQ